MCGLENVVKARITDIVVKKKEKKSKNVAVFAPRKIRVHKN